MTRDREHSRDADGEWKGHPLDSDAPASYRRRVPPTHAIFDLDNTLYPPTTGVVDRVDELINRFVMERLALDLDGANALRARYYADYGTTLNGLMRHHGIDPDDYLAAVHALDIETLLEPDPALREMLLGLDYVRVVFTNGSARHAARVLDRLGVRDCFAEVFSLERVDYVPKPMAAAFGAVLAAIGVPAGRCLLVDDRPANVSAARRLGMTTVLVDHGMAVEDVDADYRIASVLELRGVLATP
jgi:putative hydrolase of the HAD superfamily